MVDKDIAVFSLESHRPKISSFCLWNLSASLCNKIEISFVTFMRSSLTANPSDSMISGLYADAWKRFIDTKLNAGLPSFKRFDGSISRKSLYSDLNTSNSLEYLIVLDVATDRKGSTSYRPMSVPVKYNTFMKSKSRKHLTIQDSC